MKVTIEGTLDQVRETIMPGTSTRAKPGEGAIAKRNAEIRRRRGILYRAFKLVRHDPAYAEDAADLIAALGGRAPLADALLKRAEKIIGAHT